MSAPLLNASTLFSIKAEEILDIYAGPVIPIAKAFNLTLIAANSSVLHTPEFSQGTVTLGVTGEKGLPVAPITPLSGKAWEIFTWASRRVWETKEGDVDAAGGHGSGEVIIAPSASSLSPHEILRPFSIVNLLDLYLLLS